MKRVLLSLALIFSAYAGTENFSYNGTPFCTDLAEEEYSSLFDKYCDSNTDWTIADICADIVENENFDAYDRYCYNEDSIKNSYSCESTIKSEIKKQFNEDATDYNHVYFSDLYSDVDVESLWEEMGLKVFVVVYDFDTEYNQFLVTVENGCQIKDIIQLVHLDM